MEVGALSRMTLSGEYKGNVSVMDRIVAKSLEAKRFCEIIEELIKLLKLQKAAQKNGKYQLKQKKQVLLNQKEVH